LPDFDADHTGDANSNMKNELKNFIKKQQQQQAPSM